MSVSEGNSVSKKLAIQVSGNSQYQHKKWYALDAPKIPEMRRDRPGDPWMLLAKQFSTFSQFQVQ